MKDAAEETAGVIVGGRASALSIAKLSAAVMMRIVERGRVAGSGDFVRGCLIVAVSIVAFCTAFIGVEKGGWNKVGQSL